MSATDEYMGGQSDDPPALELAVDPHRGRATLYDPDDAGLARSISAKQSAFVAVTR